MAVITDTMRTCIIGKENFWTEPEATTHPTNHETDFSIVCEIIPESEGTYYLTVTCAAKLTENGNEIGTYSIASTCPISNLQPPKDCDVVSYAQMLTRFFISVLRRSHNRLEEHTYQYVLNNQIKDIDIYRSIQPLISQEKIQGTIFNFHLNPPALQTS